MSQLAQIVVPVADYLDARPSSVVPPLRPATVGGKAIALLANWKPISVPFMAALGRAIAEREPIKVAYSGFPGWRFTHPEMVAAIGPQADRLAHDCDLMVSGVAD